MAGKADAAHEQGGSGSAVASRPRCRSTELLLGKLWAAGHNIAVTETVFVLMAARVVALAKEVAAASTVKAAVAHTAAAIAMWTRSRPWKRRFPTADGLDRGGRSLLWPRRRPQYPRSKPLWRIRRMLSCKPWLSTVALSAKDHSFCGGCKD